MPRFRSEQSTEVELEILQVLWKHEPCPLGRIHEIRALQSDRAYSTTRKMVQVMRKKGLISCDDSTRPQIYSAAQSKERTLLGHENATTHETHPAARPLNLMPGVHQVRLALPVIHPHEPMNAEHAYSNTEEVEIEEVEVKNAITSERIEDPIDESRSPANIMRTVLRISARPPLFPCSDASVRL